MRRYCAAYPRDSFPRTVRRRASIAESVRRSSLPKRASSQFRQMRVACSSEELFIDRAFPLRSLRCFVLR
uniref:Uncharacterized protein n=1 Tax=Trichuris muris TaxID=70415 RepID=A0A5S6QKD9_TRIMR